MADNLTRALRRLAGRRPPHASGSLADPGSPFEALLHQRLSAVEQEVAELRGRMYGLLFLVAGAVLAQLVGRLLE